MDNLEKQKTEDLLVFLARTELALSYTITLLNMECGRLAEKLRLCSKFKQKKDYADLSRKIEDIDKFLEKTFYQRIINVYDRVGEPYDVENFDLTLFEANELARLVLLYADKTAKSNENYEKIFKFIGDIKEGAANVLNQETYDKFYLKTFVPDGDEEQEQGQDKQVHEHFGTSQSANGSPSKGSAS